MLCIIKLKKFTKASLFFFVVFFFCFSLLVFFFFLFFLWVLFVCGFLATVAGGVGGFWGGFLVDSWDPGVPLEQPLLR